jgi:hypothetical protein
MAIDFPASPTLNDVFTVGNVTYVWDGTKWTASVTGGISLDKIEEGNTSAEVIDTGSDGRFVVTTEGTERLFVNSSGQVGVGTTPSNFVHLSGSNAAQWLQIDGSASALLIGQNTANTHFGITNGTKIMANNASYPFAIGNNQAQPLIFGTSSVEAMRIDSSQRVGIGTSSPGDFQFYAKSAGAYSAAFETTTDQSSNGAPRRIVFTARNFRPSIEGQFFSGTWQSNDLLINPSGGNVGIGTTSPAHRLHVSGGSLCVDGFANSASNYITLRSGYAPDAAGGSGIKAVNHAAGNDDGLGLFGHDGLSFYTAQTERARIDSSGRLLVGTSTNIRSSKLQVLSTGNDHQSLVGGNQIAQIELCRSSDSAGGAGLVADGNVIARIECLGNDGSVYRSAARIEAVIDGTPGANDMPGRLVFSTTGDGSGSPTERMRIGSVGFLKASDNGTYHSAGGSYHEFRQSISNSASLVVTASNGSYIGNLIHASTVRAATNAYSLLKLESGTFSDVEFNFTGNGNAFADGSFSGGGADYAEYFEWSDANPDEEDRRGISVVLDGDKIREAQAGEDPIGVISGNPSVVGDAAWNKWSGKYLRDEFGTYVQEDYEVEDEDGNTVVQQRRKLNPAYNPDVEYISREQRPEWDCVGLMGKLRIRKGQVTGSRWIKMRDISATVEEWLVR